jgi:membrane protein implicated in regulation of membrane protease activity
MQWMFLVLGLVAAVCELATGTFYLAGLAAAALLTALAGLWVAPGMLPVAFVILCIAVLPAVRLLRRRLARSRALPDADIGQSVTVVSVAAETRHLVVSYRGSRWDAVVDKGMLPAPGQSAVITAKTDKLLHLALPAEAPRR